MAYRERPFTDGGVYHIFNRGVEKRSTFLDHRDYHRFLDTLLHYQQRTAELRKFARGGLKLEDRAQPFRFELLAYCLMPNHFHLLIRQSEEGGISQAMSQLLNSYTKYFNTRRKRVGHLFQGRFKAVSVVHDDQLMHVFRYILLNPYAAGLTEDVRLYPYSSLREHLGETETAWCAPSLLNDLFENKARLTSFVLDYADEARSRGTIQKFTIDDSDPIN